MTELKALVVDYGGVLTGSLPETLGAWCTLDGIDPAVFGEVMREYLGSVSAGAVNPVHQLEMGLVAIPEFEASLAATLTARGCPVVPEGLLKRMFAGFAPEPVVLGALRKARQLGLRTALLSNSWGNDYPRETWAELFDVTVISGEVGMRKPNPDIYLHTAELLRLAPTSCVFVDDLSPNVRGATAVGMVGVHHTDPRKTVAELSDLFGVDLTPA